MPKPLEGIYSQIVLSPEKEKNLATSLVTKIEEALADRKDLEARWERAYRLYEGTRTEKNHPWQGASNVHIPLVAIHASAIHARFMTTLFTPEPFWRVRSKNPELQDFTTSSTEYMDWSRQSEFPFYQEVRSFAWDAIKLGMGLLKVTWKTLKGKEVHYNEKYEIVEEEVTIEDRPEVKAVPPNLFVWPAGYDNIQTAPWIAEILKLTPGEFKRLVVQGYLQKRDQIVTERDQEDRIDIIRNETAGLFLTNKEEVKLYEVYARVDVAGTGIEDEVQMIIEPDSYTIWRLNPLPYFHRRRPYVVGRLESREHQISGLGVADQIGDLNDELNTIHNQLIDATTSSIVQMYGVRAGSPASDALDKIWPGKKIPGSSKDDVWEIGLGPLKVNSIQLEEYVRAVSERRTGISDFGLGREPSPGRRGTATGTLAIIQEGNKKFDYQIRDMREALGEVGLMLLSLFQQMNPQGIIREVLGPDGVNMKRIYVKFPTDPIHRAVSVEVVASSSTVNRQVQRQDAITLFQILMGFYTQAFQFGQVLGQPGLPPPIMELGMRLAKGAEVMMKEILNSFENRRADELLPDLEELYGSIAQASAAQGLAFSPGLQNPAGGVPPAGGGGPPIGGGGGPQAPGGGV